MGVPNLWNPPYASLVQSLFHGNQHTTHHPPLRVSLPPPSPRSPWTVGWSLPQPSASVLATASRDATGISQTTHGGNVFQEKDPMLTGQLPQFLVSQGSFCSTSLQCTRTSRRGSFAVVFLSLFRIGVGHLKIAMRSAGHLDHKEIFLQNILQ